MLVGCWIREDVANAYGEPDKFIEKKLSSAGWYIARTLVREVVDAQIYLRKADGREFFEQTLQDGFVANFRTRPRETIGELNVSDLRHGFLKFAHQLSRKGVAVSLYSEADHQWVNGVTPDGDEFLPIWLDGNAASGWVEHWPGYVSRDIKLQELHSSFLGHVNDADMWVALSLEQSVLVTFHPVSHREALKIC